MKTKTGPGGPGLIVALGAPSDNAGKMGLGGSATGDRPGADDGAGARGADGGTEDCSTDCVPVSMLSMPDDQEQMQPPAVGDVVNYQVTGRVTAISGDNAIVQRQSINGQDMPDSDQDDDQNANPQGGDDGGSQSLRDEAAGMGNSEY